jgi:hypothetical protein
MKFRAWLLPIFLTTALGSVHFLPKAGQTAQSAVNMDLPDEEFGWQFQKLPASPEELGTLEKDTRFAKAVCLKPRPGEITLDGELVPDRIDMSVVLSGHDLNNSIHRPERCMPAQGHNILSSRNVQIQLANGREFTVKRLKSTQQFRRPGQTTDIPEFQCLTYYFFVGSDQITHDHLERTFIDMKDRLFRGMDQRWAYVSVSMWYGKIPWIEKEVPEEETDRKLSEFLMNFASERIDWGKIRR